jgi:hypothetical protein
VKKEQAILRAERLRAVMSMPEYKTTVGAWLEDAKSSALHEMEVAVEPHQFHSAQGAYKAMKGILEQFDRVFALEQAAINKMEKERANDHRSD